MSRERERMLQGQAQAADQQPWRCVKCGQAVSRIRFTHCRCTREWFKQAEQEQAAQAK